jgi:cell division protein FtsQ
MLTAAHRPAMSTDAATAKAPRRRRRTRRQTVAMRWGGFGLAALALVGAFGALWTSGVATAAAQAVGHMALAVSGAAGFRVEEVLVAGRSAVDPALLLEAIGAGRGDPILGVDPAAARASLLALPWVRDAAVERRLPDTLFVHIEERSPLALWQHDGRFSLIDGAGRELPISTASTFPDLPMVVGGDAASVATELMTALGAVPEIAGRVDTAVRVGGRRWDLHLDGGVTVKLPEAGVAEALGRLAALQREDRLLDRDVVSIDLRLPDRLFIRSSTLSSARKSVPEEST